MTDDQPVRVGVVGVGNMGAHHARVYAELPGVELVGVADADWARAAAVADDYGTRPLNQAALLRAVDAVSIVVPTRYHADVARDGRDLVVLAADRDLRLQIGHIERFNPAVETLQHVVTEMDVLAVDARRLGPPIDRDNTDSTVRDLMIHDLDVVQSLFDADVADVEASAVEGEPHVAATLTLDNGVLATLTASRVTHQKVRQLAVTGRECQVTVDYLTQSVDIHRQSLPEYVERDGDVRYRSESVVERPQVNSGEPLYRELELFVDAVRNDRTPAVTGEDGLRALELTRRIEAVVDQQPATVTESQL